METENGNLRNFGSTNPHGTAFAPKQCLYQNEATGMDNPKCIALLRGKTAPTRVGLQTTPFHGGQYRARMERCESSDLLIPMVLHLYQSNAYIKMKLRVWRAQKCIALIGAETVVM